MASYNQHEKFGIPVCVHIADGSQILGSVFVYSGKRVMELMCDEKSFFALRTRDETTLVNKKHVVRIELMSIERIQENLDSFPHVDLDYLRYENW